MKLSQIFGAEAVSKDGVAGGYVMSVIRKGNEIEGFICCDERETEFFADVRGAVLRGDKLCFKHSRKPPKTGKSLRLGYPVYSHLGKLLGRADDFLIKGRAITSMVVGKKRYAFEALEIGDAVIVGDARIKTEVTAKDMLIDAVLSAKE